MHARIYQSFRKKFIGTMFKKEDLIMYWPAGFGSIRLRVHKIDGGDTQDYTKQEYVYTESSEYEDEWRFESIQNFIKNMKER